MITYLNKIQLILFSNPISIKLFFILIALYIIKFLRHAIFNYIFNIEKMKINYPVFYVLNTILFILFYICLLGYWRFLNMTKTLNLKNFIYQIVSFIKKNNIYDTTLLFICLILTIFILYYLIIFLKKYFFIHFLKIELFIHYFTRRDFYYEMTYYDNIKTECTHLSTFFDTFIVDNIIIFFYKLYLRYHKREYKDKWHSSDVIYNIKNKLDLYKHEERFPSYIIIISLLYDIIYNNMILTKIYYISFILFFYYLFHKITALICFQEAYCSIKIYDYLYKKDHNVTKEDITYINNSLLRIDSWPKSTYSLDYYENILIKLSWSTYLLLISIFILKYILLSEKLTILLNQQVINRYIIFIIIIGSLTLLWFFSNNRIIENVFLLIFGILTFIFILLFIDHNVPLLYNDTFFETTRINLLNNYTVDDKLIFIKEYFMLKIQHFNIENQIKLLKIFKSIPVEELLQKTIIEIKNYQDNIVIIYETIQNDN